MRSFFGFTGIISLLILLSGIVVLGIDFAFYKIVFFSDAGIIDYTFNYNTVLLSNSQIENIFYKRLFLLYIPSLVFIISLFGYMKSKRNENVKESNRALFLISATIFFIFFNLSLFFNLSFKVTTILFLMTLFFIFLRLYLIKKYVSLKDNLALKYSSFAKIVYFLLILKLCFFIIILNIFGLFVKSENNLKNNETLIFPSVLSNSCSHENGRKVLKELGVVKECYHERFEKKMSYEKILFLSLIDDNFNVMDYINLKDLIMALENPTDEDIIYLYQRAFEGLVRKNDKFKNQSNYDENVDFHKIGDKFIEKEEICYNESLKLSAQDFMKYIKDNESCVVLSYDFLSNVEYEGKIKMSELIEFEKKFNNHNKKDFKDNDINYIKLFNDNNIINKKHLEKVISIL